MGSFFKLSGTNYASKSGTASNNGTSVDTPLPTIINAPTTNLVIGSGVYEVNYSFLQGTFNADGLVVFEGLGSLNLGLLGTYTGIIFRNYPTFGYNFAQTAIVSDCIFNTVTFSVATSSSTQTYTRCIFVNCTGTAQTQAYQFIDCIFINTNFHGITKFEGCYSNSASRIGVNTAIGATFDYNNIMGDIRVAVASIITTGVIQDSAGNYYDLSVAGSGGTGAVGTPYQRSNTANADFGLTAHKVAYPTCNANSINSTPLFNNVSKLDFTLQLASPHIRTGVLGRNIGGTNYSRVFYNAVTDEMLTANGATISNLSGTTDLDITSGNSGYHISAPIQISTITEMVAMVRYLGALLFDKAQTGGGVKNTNVPDAVVVPNISRAGTTTNTSPIITGISTTADFVVGMHLKGSGIPVNAKILTIDSGTQITMTVNATASASPTLAWVPAGNNPDRLTFEMRWSTQLAEPAGAGEWDNQGLVTADAYAKFCWNEQPKVDNVMVGSGSPEFNLITAQPIAAKWIQVKTTLNDNYIN